MDTKQALEALGAAELHRPFSGLAGQFSEGSEWVYAS
jgi:hypothetical protein